MTPLGVRRFVAAAFGAALALSAADCGGSSGGVWDGLVASFSAEEPSPGPSTVALAQAAVTNDMVKVEVRVRDVDGVFGAAFYLLYDPTIARFERSGPGEILEAGSQTPFYLVEEAQPGLLVVSATRLGAIPAVDVVGSKVLMSLTFRVIEVGAGAATFQAAALYGDQLQPDPMDGIDWYGGEIVGR